MSFRRAQPSGEDGIERPFASDVENEAYRASMDGADSQDDVVRDGEVADFDDKPTDDEFLQIVRDAVAQSQLYLSKVNQRSWTRTYRAYHQEHFQGSKYTSREFDNRSKLFIPKTRGAVRKDMAAVAASLFGSLDAVTCSPGNEGDAAQRASAAVVQELLNYRTNRSSNKASIPWFHVAMGARQTAILSGICLSKQYWKLELRRAGEEEVDDEETGEKMTRDVWVPDIDRPDSVLIAPENFEIDPAADWTNPAQSAAYIIIKWPMRIDEIRRKQNDPRMPWKELPNDVLKANSDQGSMTQEAIRRAREQGIDRFDRAETGNTFDVIWVYETFVRTGGVDWTFLSLKDAHMLTEPRPVREVYPEQFGERPLTMGYGAIEAFRIFPMSPAESWQMLQQESNDIRNLSLDSVKQSVMPVTKVVRGRQVDLDQLRRRGQGTAIMVNAPDDVTFEKVPDLSSGVQMMKQQIDLEFDDLAGQQNYGTVQDNNNLGKTLGGLKLAAGAANAVQEFDIRVWIETWCEPTLSQIARLCQFYESDPIVLGLCGERAKLFQKFGISEISDQLLENEVTIRVNIGLGAGDPQQRLAKFQSAIAVAGPLLQNDPKFQSGELQMNTEEVMAEVFGAAGYRDGGRRFIIEGQPKQNPMAGLEQDSLKAKTEKDRATAKKAIIDALANAAKVGIALEGVNLARLQAQFGMHVDHIDQVARISRQGIEDADSQIARQNVAKGLAPDGSPIDTPEEEAQVAAIKAEMGEGGAAPEAGSDAAPAPQEAAPAAPRKRSITNLKRGADGRIASFDVVDG